MPKKLYTPAEVNKALNLIGKAEATLGVLTLGEATDLLADNYTTWSLDKCHAVAHAAFCNIGMRNV